jgi:hypothetical protein
MLGCFGKSCKTKSASPRRKTPSPRRSPAVKGFTVIGRRPIVRKNGVLKTNFGQKVFWVVNTKKTNANKTGYYTKAELNTLLSTPNWNFSIKT